MTIRRGLRLAAAVLLALLLTGAAAMAEARDITAECKYWVSEGKAAPMKDAKINTAWQPKAENAEVRFGFPEGAGYITIDWFDDPSGFVFTQLDADLNPISTSTDKDTYPAIHQVFRLDPAARNASLILTEPGQAIHKVRIYSQGELPADVKDFDAPPEKCDLLVISTHQDDEWIFFGGIIPYYNLVREKDVQVLYMADCKRPRKGEALNGLWAAGCRYYPEFADLKDLNVDSYDETLEYWGGSQEVVRVLVEQIRRYKPEIILTHDWNGEYGHNQHKVTARHMRTAIEAASSPALFPESAEKYGAWQVKKLYLHLADANGEIDFEWNTPYDALGGQTPLQVAQRAYEEHPSQHKYYQVNDGGKYDNSRFGLTFSVVGDDQLYVDLFENIDDPAALIPQPAATPEPTAAPTAEPVAAAAEPTAEPTAAPAAAEEKQTGGRGVLIALIGALAAAAGVLAAAIYLRSSRAKPSARRSAPQPGRVQRPQNRVQRPTRNNVQRPRRRQE